MRLVDSGTLAPKDHSVKTGWSQIKVCDSGLTMISYFKRTPTKKNIISQIGNVLNWETKGWVQALSFLRVLKLLLCSVTEHK